MKKLSPLLIIIASIFASCSSPNEPQYLLQEMKKEHVRDSLRNEMKLKMNEQIDYLTSQGYIKLTPQEIKVMKRYYESY